MGTNELAHKHCVRYRQGDRYESSKIERASDAQAIASDTQAICYFKTRQYGGCLEQLNLFIQYSRSPGGAATPPHASDGQPAHNKRPIAADCVSESWQRMIPVLTTAACYIALASHFRLAATFCRHSIGGCPLLLCEARMGGAPQPRQGRAGEAARVAFLQVLLLVCSLRLRLCWWRQHLHQPQGPLSQPPWEIQPLRLTTPLVVRSF